MARAKLEYGHVRILGELPPRGIKPPSPPSPPPPPPPHGGGGGSHGHGPSHLPGVPQGRAVGHTTALSPGLLVEAFAVVSGGSVPPSPPSPPSDAMVKLFDTTLAVANATIDTGAGGIAGTASHLLVYLYLRSNAAATNDHAGLRFNGDTSSIYYQSEVDSGNSLSAGASSTVAANQMALLVVCAANAPANAFTPMVISVPQYAGTVGSKSANIQAGFQVSHGATGTQSSFQLGFWDSTAAVTQIQIIATTGQFVAGSRMTVYGLI